MKHLTEPALVIVIIAVLVATVMSRALFRLISLAVLVGLIALAWYVYKTNHVNIITDVRHIFESHLPKAAK
jgi:hypothetical protein